MKSMSKAECTLSDCKEEKRNDDEDETCCSRSLSHPSLTSALPKNSKLDKEAELVFVVVVVVVVHRYSNVLFVT